MVGCLLAAGAAEALSPDAPLEEGEPVDGEGAEAVALPEEGDAGAGGAAPG